MLLINCYGLLVVASQHRGRLLLQETSSIISDGNIAKICC